MMPEDNKVSYCIHFECPEPINQGHEGTHCKRCGAKLLVGDRYRLVKQLHETQKYMPKLVYEALDTENDNKPVILKIIDFTRPDLVPYLEREYNFLCGARPPFYNVKRGDYFEWLPEPVYSNYKVFVLVIPKIEGITTEQWVKEKCPISEVQCLEWIIEISEYLVAFAEMSIIYRDLTPSNIMITPDECVKLIDFGTVKEIDQEYLLILDSGIPNESRTDIRRGTRIYTYAYAPPEQLRGQAVPQSDFYALGRTIVFWLTGQNPEYLVENGKIDIEKHRPDISKTFVHFLDWLLQEKASARPINAECIRNYMLEDFPYLVQVEDDGIRYYDYKNKLKLAQKVGAGIGAGALLTLVLAWFGAGEFFQAQGQQSLATEDYSRALNELSIARILKPFSLETLKQKGFACLGKQDYECADRLYRRALKQSPNDAVVLYHLGITQEELSKFDLAKEFYQRSIEANPNQMDSQLRLARLSLEDDSPDVAQTYLTDIQEQFEARPEKVRASDRALFLYYQGWFHLIQKDYQAAETSLLESSKLLPDDQPLSINQGDVQCLLAEATQQSKRSKAEVIGAWHGCFQQVPNTLEAARIKDQALQNLLNPLKNDNISQP